MTLNSGPSYYRIRCIRPDSTNVGLVFNLFNIISNDPKPLALNVYLHVYLRFLKKVITDFKFFGICKLS